MTRSTAAGTARTAAQVAQRRRALPNGWWGAALLIATEATLFGTLLASYYYLRFQSVAWPPAGIAPPDKTAPLILTGVLVASAAPMFAAARAAGAGRTRAVWWLVLAALAAQGAYFGLQMHFFLADLDKLSPKATAYGSIYFTLLGVHHAHVAVGLLLDVWLLGRLLRGLTNYRVIATRVIALYWYFVALVGILVVATQLYPSW